MDVTRRGVLYIGHKCNLSCKFCYYRFMEKKSWSPLKDCLERARILKLQYGNQFVDITGGEPSLYPDLLPLIEFCRAIGLLPSCISNGLAFSSRDLCSQIKDAGIHDLLISTHGVGDVYDDFVGKTGAFAIQESALQNLVDLEIPFRFNVVLLEPIAKQLTEIVERAHQFGVKIVNLIGFNLFETWDDPNKMDTDVGFKFSNMKEYINRAISMARSLDIEVNLRYVPFCVLPDHPECVYNWQQLSFDPHEWDLNSWNNVKGVIDPGEDWYLDYSRKLPIREQAYSKESCQGCSRFKICDGFNRHYQERYGSGECNPIKGQEINDPRHYLSHKKDPFYFLSDREQELSRTDVNLGQIQYNHKRQEGSVLVESTGVHTEIPLGYFRYPFKIEAVLSGPAQQVGFSLGSLRDLFFTLEDNSPHKAILEASQNGFLSLTLDGATVEVPNRDLGNLQVRPFLRTDDTRVYLKTRQSACRVHSVSYSTGVRSRNKLSILTTSVGYSRRLAYLLRSLGEQTTRDFDVWVAFNPKRDDSQSVVDMVKGVYPDLEIQTRPFTGQASKARMVNELLHLSQGEEVLITDSDIIFPPDLIERVLNDSKQPHFSILRALVPRRQTEQILLGSLDPFVNWGDIAHNSEITKWGNVVRNYQEDPALGYFQWTDGSLAREIGYSTRYSGYSGSDDMFSLEVLKRLGLRQVPMIDGVVLHLDHGESNWRGLRENKWL